MKTTIGVLSDTHGLLREEVINALKRCNVILHAGDINKREIIARLQEIAPVFVVRGNNDKDWAEDLPLFIDTTIAGLRVYITHKKKDLPSDLSAYDLAVIGHSHKYAETKDGDTIILNPGSCGPRRFDQEITLATITINDKAIKVRKILIPHLAGTK